MSTIVEDAQTHDIDPVVTKPELGGRASFMANRRSTHIFGAMATDPGNPITSFVDSNSVVQQAGLVEGVPKRSQCERLWRVRTDGLEVIRSGVGLAPLARGALVPNAGQLGRGLGNITAYKLLVDVWTTTGNTNFRMDIGETIDIVAAHVNVSFLGPVNATEVGSNVGPAGLRTGVVSDALVGYALNMIEAADNHVEVVYTQQLLIPSNAAAVVQIPRFAIGLKVEMGLDIVAAAWTKSVDAAALIPQAPLEFNAAGTISTTESGPLGSSGFLTTDIRAPVRFATLIWTIRP